jgi:hypothetical protein
MPLSGKCNGKTTRSGSDHRPVKCEPQMAARLVWIRRQKEHDTYFRPDRQSAFRAKEAPPGRDVHGSEQVRNISRFPLDVLDGCREIQGKTFVFPHR